ncbi:MAG: hypothetical protein DHS20C16_37050 [Phycisphaerae bacterium]|nr:MAG: hypothetical protein DHS20C16_37050 [Phycisphaerae bacterium]
MRYVLVIILAVSMLLPSRNAAACAMFTIANDNVVLMGNNEDYIKTGYIWFVPGTKKRYGRVNVGFSDKFAQGSMNEKGLSFDCASLPEVPYTPDPEKETPKNLLEKIMNECATVDEAIGYFQRFNCSHLAGGQFMFADKSGASAVVTWDPADRISIVRRDGPYQLITNERLEFSGYRSERFVLANRILANAAEPSVDVARDVLKRIHQRGEGAFTSYSTVYDLKAGTVHVYNLANFEEAVTIDLMAELAKGKHELPMEALFEHSPTLASIRDDAPVKYETRIELPESQLQRFAGDYVYESDGKELPMSIAIRDAGLVLSVEGQKEAVMHPESETLFRFVKGGQASFELATDGSVSAMVLHRNGDYRAPRVP